MGYSNYWGFANGDNKGLCCGGMLSAFHVNTAENKDNCRYSKSIGFQCNEYG